GGLGVWRAATPAAGSGGRNRIDCFAKGTDNHMWHKWWDGAAWSGWEDPGGGIDNAPGAGSCGAHRRVDLRRGGRLVGTEPDRLLRPRDGQRDVPRVVGIGARRSTPRTESVVVELVRE